MNSEKHIDKDLISLLALGEKLCYLLGLKITDDRLRII